MAASGRTPALDPANETLALEQHASSQSSTAPRRRARDAGGRLAGVSTLVRQRSASVASGFFQALDHPFWNSHYTLTADASPKKMALIGESVQWRIDPSTPLRTSLWMEYAKLPARLSNRRLETRRHPTFRKRSAATVVHQNGRAPARPAPDLRRFLHARQFRLRAVPIPRANAPMDVIR